MELTSSIDTPMRSSRSQRRPATAEALDDLLDELKITPLGETSYELVSEWAAKHVWRVFVDDTPWAYIRYLLGPARQFPDRWRHLRLGALLHDATVGPRILGLSGMSRALSGRAAIVEEALTPLPEGELQERAIEAIALMARLHSDTSLYTELAVDQIDADLAGASPLVEMGEEVRTRWFEAVQIRWRAFGLNEIGFVLSIVEDVFAQLRLPEGDQAYTGLLVPCHNDPNRGNFMLNANGELRLIDFEGLSLNSPVADLGIFLTWYVEPGHHTEVLAHYPLIDSQIILERIKQWVPLHYLKISAHWAARLIRAREKEAWEFAVYSFSEWLSGALGLVYRQDIPQRHAKKIGEVTASLIERWSMLQ